MASTVPYPTMPMAPLIAWLTQNFQHDGEDIVEVDGVERITNNRIADLCDWTRTRVSLYRSEGIPWDIADRVAVHLGLVPSLMWSEWEAEEIHLHDTVDPSIRYRARYAIRHGHPIEHLCDAHHEAS